MHLPQHPTPQIRHRALSTATGSTASLATRLPARATGPAGMVRITRSPQTSCIWRHFQTALSFPGTATEQFCIGGLLYNEETHACDWPQNVAGCQKHREWFLFLCFYAAFLALNRTSRISMLMCAPQQTSGRQNRLTPSIPALCKDDANGNVPLGKSCNR